VLDAAMALAGQIGVDAFTIRKLSPMRSTRSR
jgi:hypothetical protein